MDISQRAHEYAERKSFCSICEWNDKCGKIKCDVYYNNRNEYYHIAKSQRDNDIENACKWWINFCNERGMLVYEEHIQNFTKCIIDGVLSRIK